MDEYNSQEILELLLYDYMVKNNRRETAETFSKEANLNLDPTSIPFADDHDHGLLREWWLMFHDMLFSLQLGDEEHNNNGETSSVENLKNTSEESSPTTTTSTKSNHKEGQ